MYYTRFNTPFCEVILAGNKSGLTHLHLETREGNRAFKIDPAWQKAPLFFKSVRAQILEYFDGRRQHFEVAINPRGTDFQKKVWKALCRIPYGGLRSYADIAVATGNKKAARAVGTANGKNPIPLIIPCHRVVGANGSLTGFAHGIKIKEELIRLEHAFTVCRTSARSNITTQ